MKKSIFLILAASLFACTKTEKIDYLVFSGEVKNAEQDSIFVLGDKLRIGIALDEKGNFSDTLNLPSGYYSFSLGRESSALYLEQGKDLHLSIDPEEFDESITYSGTGAAANNVLASLYLLEETMVGDPREFYAQEEAAYLAAVKNMEDSSIALISGSHAGMPFEEDQLKNARYKFATKLLNYENYHSHYAKLPDFKVSESFAQELPDIPLNDENTYKTSEAYRTYLGSAFSTLIDGQSEEDESYTQSIMKAADNWENGYVKNELINEMAPYLLSPNEEMDAVYSFLTSTVNDTAYLAAYAKKYESLQALRKGQDSPTFIRYENHAGDSTSFEDLKGKYLYFDIWATWCGPCIREIPSLKALEESYRNKNIQFVSISIDQDRDYETWLKMVDEKELTGIQLKADKAWGSDFTKAYQVNSIPRFILVDPEGKIVSADAPRPSDAKLIELFDELGI